jgi:hypothetical protein
MIYDYGLISSHCTFPTVKEAPTIYNVISPISYTSEDSGHSQKHNWATYLRRHTHGPGCLRAPLKRGMDYLGDLECATRFPGEICSNRMRRGIRYHQTRQSIRTDLFPGLGSPNRSCKQVATATLSSHPLQWTGVQALSNDTRESHGWQLCDKDGVLWLYRRIFSREPHFRLDSLLLAASSQICTKMIVAPGELPRLQVPRQYLN